jgi:hypothetical protein
MQARRRGRCHATGARESHYVEVDEIRRWDEVESEVRALLKRISEVNRKRRHRLGRPSSIST